ncbi:MAG: NADH-quinone oxidoreductase subunit NuoH [Dehalococcoidia bacterium]|nr:NADH-quinone oxidoreductase subunit NuoH [Dehalococcoidia bacterium]
MLDYSYESVVSALPGFLTAEWVPGLNLLGLLGVFLILNLILVTVLALTWLERKVLGNIQLRPGPMINGPHGVLQAPADAVKLLVKEDLTPAAADKKIFKIGPYLVFLPVFLMFLVIPWSRDVVVRALDLGLLYIVAIPAISTVGLVMSGWSSGNKYSMLGAARAVAQLIAYELPLVVALLAVALLTQSMSLSAIVEAQTNLWFIFIQPLGFFLFLTSALAENNRTPFDIPIAESELVGGPFVEYSGMRWALFFLTEYASVFLNAALAATLYLGGWTFFGLPGAILEAVGLSAASGLGGTLVILIGFGFFFVKTGALIISIMWLRGTLPRLRIDQLMSFAWKALLPVALANLVLTAILVVFGNWPAAVATAITVLAFAIVYLLLRRRAATERQPVRLARVPARPLSP